MKKKCKWYLSGTICATGSNSDKIKNQDKGSIMYIYKEKNGEPDHTENRVSVIKAA